MASVVMVVSGANVWTMKNAKPHSTGFWSEEFVTPHRNFTEARLKVTVASPGGVDPTVDPLSFNLSYNNNDASKVREQQDYEAPRLRAHIADAGRGHQSRSVRRHLSRGRTRADAGASRVHLRRLVNNRLPEKFRALACITDFRNGSSCELLPSLFSRSCDFAA